MYISDGIAYAGEPAPILSVTSIDALENFKLKVHFNNNDIKIVDMKPLLSSPCFSPLSDINIFKSVYIDLGTPTWCNGNIDISPEYLYDTGVFELL